MTDIDKMWTRLRDAAVASGVEVPKEMPPMAKGWEVVFIGHVAVKDKLYVFIIATDWELGILPLMPPGYPTRIRRAIQLTVAKHLPELLQAELN